MTQKELADKLGISPSNVSKYEMGTLEPGVEILLAYSNFFDVSVDFILGVSSEPKHYSVSNNESIEIIWTFAKKIAAL